MLSVTEEGETSDGSVGVDEDGDGTSTRISFVATAAKFPVRFVVESPDESPVICWCQRHRTPSTKAISLAPPKDRCNTVLPFAKSYGTRR